MIKFFTTLALAAATVATSSVAYAGVNANLDGDTLEVDCTSGCHIVIRAVGSRVHIHDVTNTFADERAPDGYHATTCYQGASWLPTRKFSFAQADVDLIVVDGSGDNDFVELRGLAAEASVELHGGADMLKSNMWVSARLGSGNDCADLSAGGDVWGQDDNDYIDVIGGDAFVDGGENNDTIETGDGNDRIFGGRGEDTIRANAGNDVIFGNKGSDNINAGDGDDRVHGGSGRDVINGGEGDDYLKGDSGKDTIFGEGGDDELYGNNGEDKLQDKNGANYLDGGNDDDTLIAAGTNTSVDGNSGQDTCILTDGASGQSCEK